MQIACCLLLIGGIALVVASVIGYVSKAARRGQTKSHSRRSNPFRLTHRAGGVFVKTGAATSVTAPE